LPNELLSKIFQETYADWDQGKKGIARPKPFTSPLSKRLVDFQRQGLYRHIKVTRWTGTRSLSTLIEAVIRQPHIGSFVVSLRFETAFPSYLSFAILSDDPDLPSETIKVFFGLLTGLRHFTIEGDVSQEDSSIITVYAERRAALLALGFIMASPHVVSVSEEWYDPYNSSLSPPSPSQTPSSKLSQVHVRADDPESGFGLQLGGPSTGLITFNFDSSRTASALPAQSRPLPSTSDNAKRSPVSSLFTSLQTVDFTYRSLRSTTPLLPLLPQFPIDNLTFVINAHTVFPILKIVSTSRPSRKFEFSYYGARNFDGEIGQTGTRVSNVDFDRVFRGIHPDTEDITQDAMPDDWTYPEFPDDFPCRELLTLREKAIEMGFEFDGGKLYEAIEVQQAVNDDVKLLNELWQKWKKRSRNSGKGRKSR